MTKPRCCCCGSDKPASVNLDGACFKKARVSCSTSKLIWNDRCQSSEFNREELRRRGVAPHDSGSSGVSAVCGRESGGRARLSLSYCAHFPVRACDHPLPAAPRGNSISATKLVRKVRSRQIPPARALRRPRPWRSACHVRELSPHTPYYPRWFTERLHDAAMEKVLER